MSRSNATISSAKSAWRSALQGKSFRIEIIISILALFTCAWAAPRVFQYVQNREGALLNDYLLTVLPAVDLSVWIFSILYLLIVVSVIALLKSPNNFLITLQAYILLTLLRFITMYFVPLEPPADMALLSDPFVEYFFYQETITKDLFFSGHTSILVLLGLGLPFRSLKIVVLIGSAVIGSMVLLQHAHYTIDVLAAPVFAALAFFSVSKLHARKDSKEPFSAR